MHASIDDDRSRSTRALEARATGRACSHAKLPSPSTRASARRVVDGRDVCPPTPRSCCSRRARPAPPRGVVLSRAALVAAARASAARLGWRDDDRWLLALPLAHAGGLSIVVRCLIARKPIVLARGRLRSARIAELIASARPTLASLVPTQLDATLIAQLTAARCARCCSAVPRAAPALVDAAVAAAWPVSPTYGLTETFGQIATATRARRRRSSSLPGVAIDVRRHDRDPRARCSRRAISTARRSRRELVTADLG